MHADQRFIQAYAGYVADRANPDVSPLYGDLRGLPSTLLVMAALDILLERQPRNGGPPVGGRQRG
jgi:acetyl esterase